MRTFQKLAEDLNTFINVDNVNEVPAVTDAAILIYKSYGDSTRLNAQISFFLNTTVRALNVPSQPYDFNDSIGPEEYEKDFQVANNLYIELIETNLILANNSTKLLSLLNDGVLITVSDDTKFIWIRNDDDKYAFPFNIEYWPRHDESKALLFGGFKPGTQFYIDNHWIKI